MFHDFLLLGPYSDVQDRPLAHIERLTSLREQMQLDGFLIIFYQIHDSLILNGHSDNSLKK